jgi:hypothetical protein
VRQFRFPAFVLPFTSPRVLIMADDNPLETIMCMGNSYFVRGLAHDIVKEAIRNDEGVASAVDMTCGVFYFRQPRRLMVVSGLPLESSRDSEIARALDRFAGRRVICGGTTANIVARELGRNMEIELRHCDGDLPPISTMRKIDLITEGILTLTRAVQYLESPPDDGRRDSTGGDPL